MARAAWLITQDGYEYCKLCWCFVTDSHLQARKHRKRLELFLRQPWDLEAPDFPWPEQGEPAPPEWGDSHLFSFHSPDHWFR